MAPAGDRSDAGNLDGTALFHINQDYDMIRYFVRTILQFQFLESLCAESGHTGPLYRYSSCYPFNSYCKSSALYGYTFNYSWESEAFVLFTSIFSGIWI